MSPVPDVGQVARKSPWYDEHRVDPDGVADAGVAGRQPLRGDSHATQSIFVERPGGGIFRTALLDLDEGDGLGSPSDQIDFTAGNARAPSQNVPPLQAQPPGSN